MTVAGNHAVFWPRSYKWRPLNATRGLLRQHRSAGRNLGVAQRMHCRLECSGPWHATCKSFLSSFQCLNPCNHSPSPPQQRHRADIAEMSQRPKSAPPELPASGQGGKALQPRPFLFRRRAASDPTARRRPGPRRAPRSFFRGRRGAVTGLVDPTPRPQLQGTPSNNVDGLNESERRRRRPRWRRRPRRARTPQPVEILVMPQRAQPIARYRTWANIALAVAVLTHIVAAVVIVVLLLRNWKSIAVDLPTNPAPSSLDEASEDTSFITGITVATTIMIRFALLGYGGGHLLQLGLLSLGKLFNPSWYQWHIVENHPFPTYWLWLGYAALPFAVSALAPATIGNAICIEARNINNHIPVKTRDDIKAILEAWYASATVFFQFGTAFQQFNKWPLTFERFAIFSFFAGLAAVLELKIGLCRYNKLMWDIWFPILATCTGAWFTANAKGLIGIRRVENLNNDHVQLLLFLSVLYTVRWSPVDEYCTKSGCW